MTGFVPGSSWRGDRAVDADVVVVGTGAGGAMALRELARAGLRVVAIEEGPHLTTRDFVQREETMFPVLYRDGGAFATDDLAVRILAGRGTGGSTVHNTNLCKRTPNEVLAAWRVHHHVDVSEAAMAPFFETVERDLGVVEVPAQAINGNNAVLRRGVAALGWRGGVLSHNRVLAREGARTDVSAEEGGERGCRQSGFCELGCAYDGKQNALKVLLPEAIAAGATVFCDARAVRVVHRRGRAKGLEATVTGADGASVRLTVRAPRVVLAGGAIGSPALALASDLPDPFALAGRGLRLHPGAAVAAVFDEVIDAHRGIPQSYECTELLSYDEGSPHRTWIVPAFAHPIAAAALMPGFGAPHMALLRKYRHMAVLTAMVHDESAGDVVLREGRPHARYAMNASDRAALARGVEGCVKLLRAAGAREVVVPERAPLTSVHPMGTLRMGEDPRASVVSSRGEHHHVRGLYVADASLFPTSLGAPPQISIYAFAMRIARAMAQ